MTTSSDHQLAAWLEGAPEHNTEDDECCPDFSCCRPKLLAPEHERRAYVEADEEGRMKFLGGFLGRAMSTYKPKTKVHIAGDHGDEQ